MDAHTVVPQPGDLRGGVAGGFLAVGEKNGGFRVAGGERGVGKGERASEVGRVFVERAERQIGERLEVGRGGGLRGESEPALGVELAPVIGAGRGESARGFERAIADAVAAVHQPENVRRLSLADPARLGERQREEEEKRSAQGETETMARRRHRGERTPLPTPERGQPEEGQQREGPQEFKGG